jgi:hypothetical protein
VALPELAFVDLARGIEGAVAGLPGASGVAELLGPDGRRLVLGATSNLRRWAAAQLGLGRAAPPGRRPRTNLAGIATAVGVVETRGPFHQRLTYERLMAPFVPLAERRDLKPPAFLRLDPTQRFPRVTIVGITELDPSCYGPFRDRRAAERARDAAQKLFRLRPCDYRFEPDPALAIGLGCVYAQVRSCSAPCLARVGEQDYRELASRARAWLAEPGARADAPAAVPQSVAAATSARALVVDAARGGLGLFPVRGGHVLDACARWTSVEDLEHDLRTLDWAEPPTDGASTGAAGDWPWLASWLASPRSSAAYLVLQDGEDVAELAARVAAVPARATRARAEPGSSVIR